MNIKWWSPWVGALCAYGRPSASQSPRKSSTSRGRTLLRLAQNFLVFCASSKLRPSSPLNGRRKYAHVKLSSFPFTLEEKILIPCRRKLIPLTLWPQSDPRTRLPTEPFFLALAPPRPQLLQGCYPPWRRFPDLCDLFLLTGSCSAVPHLSICFSLGFPTMLTLLPETQVLPRLKICNLGNIFLPTDFTRCILRKC